MVERLPCKQDAVGSIPTAGTKYLPHSVYRPLAVSPSPPGFFIKQHVLQLDIAGWAGILKAWG